MKDVADMFIRKGRFYVRFKAGNGKRATMPRANYVWLKSNPGFVSIPKGYVVHHLDLDATNDDPSNLVIMQKFLHVAYHWKHKRIETPISLVDERRVLISSRKPSVGFNKSRGKYYITFTDISNGDKTKTSIYTDDDGRPFLDKESAVKYSDLVWLNMQTRGSHFKLQHDKQMANANYEC